MTTQILASRFWYESKVFLFYYKALSAESILKLACKFITGFPTIFRLGPWSAELGKLMTTFLK